MSAACLSISFLQTFFQAYDERLGEFLKKLGTLISDRLKPNLA